MANPESKIKAEEIDKTNDHSINSTVLIDTVMAPADSSTCTKRPMLCVIDTPSTPLADIGCLPSDTIYWSNHDDPAGDVV